MQTPFFCTIILINRTNQKPPCNLSCGNDFARKGFYTANRELRFTDSYDRNGKINLGRHQKYAAKFEARYCLS